MAESLPKGLVTTQRTVPSDLDGPERVEIDDIALLWKVYSTNPAVLEGDLGHRLENLFWRIWSNSSLSKSIRGSNVASLFARISDQESLQSSFPARRAQDVNRDTLRSTYDPTGGQASSLEVMRSDGGGRAPNPPNRGPGRPPLPPILKRCSGSQGEASKSTRLLLTNSVGQSITRKPSNPPTPNPNGMSSTEDLVNRQTQKKSYFVVAGKSASHKRKPVLKRRKSPQKLAGVGSAGDPPEATEQWETIDTAGDTEEDQLPESSEPQQPSSETKPTELPDPPVSPWLSGGKTIFDSATPPLSRRPSSPMFGFAISSAHRHGSGQDLSPEHIQRFSQPSADSLVDKDFRGRFAEMSLPHRRNGSTTFASSSLTGPEVDGIPSIRVDYDDLINPSTDQSLLSSSEVAERAAASFDLKLPATASAGTMGVMESLAESPTQPLPRPRSHLSLLIAQDRGKQKATDR